MKWFQIFLVAFLLVLVYCGDLAPAASRTTAVLSTHTATVKELLLTPLQKDWGVIKAWNTVSDSMPAPCVTFVFCVYVRWCKKGQMDACIRIDRLDWPLFVRVGARVRTYTQTHKTGISSPSIHL